MRAGELISVNCLPRLACGKGHSNSKAFELVDGAVLASLGLERDPTSYLDTGIFGIPQSEEVEQRINRDFEETKAGF